MSDRGTRPFIFRFIFKKESEPIFLIDSEKQELKSLKHKIEG